MARSYPRDLIQFENAFRTEQDCRGYICRLRWPGGFKCPRCGHDKAWQTKNGSLRCAKCRADVSATAGTIFQGSHIPLRLWFRAIWWVTNQKSGISALGLQRALGLGSYETAWLCLHKLRRAMVRPGREQLSGTIEVDETFVGGREKGGHGGGRRAFGNKVAVAIAAEVRPKGIGRIRLAQIPDTTEKSLIGFVKRMIEPGSAIATDGWEAYSSLEEQGYLHWARPIQKRGKTGVNLLPRVHRVASLLKRWLLGMHQGKFSRKQLSYYLDEFTFRFNRRASQHRGKLFFRLMQQAVAVVPAPYKEIIRHR